MCISNWCGISDNGEYVVAFVFRSTCQESSEFLSISDDVLMAGLAYIIYNYVGLVM